MVPKYLSMGCLIKIAPAPAALNDASFFAINKKQLLPLKYILFIKLAKVGIVLLVQISETR